MTSADRAHVHEAQRDTLGGRLAMNDFTFVLLTLGFFTACVAYVYFCEKLR